MTPRPAVTPVELAEPISINGPDGPWWAVRDEVLRRGSCVLVAVLPDWPEHADGDAPDERLRGLLGQEWDRYVSLPHAQMRKRFAVSRTLLKEAAGAVLGTSAEMLELGVSPGGRPYLRGHAQLDITLSHTEEVLLVGLTTRGLIGVDVEQADRTLVSGQAPPHICTPWEREQLLSLPDEERGEALVRFWTLKEAFTKAIGQGLRFPFNGFCFGPDDGVVRVLRADGTPGSGDEWTFVSHRVSRRHIAGVALYDTGTGGQPSLGATVLDEGVRRALAGG